MKYLDITRTIFEGMKKYSSDPEVEVRRFKSLHQGNSCNLNRLVMGSHTGTHMDAPRHIYENGRSVDRISPEDMICKAFVLDMAKCTLTEFFKSKRAAIVRGMLFKNAGRGLTPREAEMLRDRDIRVVGITRMSIEGSSDKSHPVHRILLENGIPIIEGLDLRKAKAGHCTLICLPLKIKNGDGAPARAFLVYD